MPLQTHFQGIKGHNTVMEKMGKITINDSTWFGATDFKGKKTLSPTSAIRLKVVSILYPLPFLLEGLFFISLVSLAILPFIYAKIWPPVPALIIYGATVPCYLLLRKLCIKRCYHVSSGLSCLISHGKVELPACHIMDVSESMEHQPRHPEPREPEPQGPQCLTVARTEIQNIVVSYWPTTRDVRTSYIPHALFIITASGRNILLKAGFFPIQQMLYLLVYFDYPLTFEKAKWSLVHTLRLMLIAFPVVAHIAVTGFLYKDYFL